MSEHRVDGIPIGEDESKEGVRVCMFQNSVEFFPNGKTQATIVRERHIVNGGFREGFRVFRGADSFVQKVTNCTENNMLGKFVVFEKLYQKINF